MNQTRYVTEQLGELASSVLTAWSDKPENRTIWQVAQDMSTAKATLEDLAHLCEIPRSEGLHPILQLWVWVMHHTMTYYANGQFLNLRRHQEPEYQVFLMVPGKIVSDVHKFINEHAKL